MLLEIFNIKNLILSSKVCCMHSYNNLLNYTTFKVEMERFELSSYIFASKHSYSLGFKDYPCHHKILSITRLTPFCS